MSKHRQFIVLLSLLVPLLAVAESHYLWLAYRAQGTIESRITPPEGFVRVPVDNGSFAEWLRGLPLLPGRPPVHLFDGTEKGNQDAHYAVIQMDVGNQDLQQCADAVMRLRAEYLYSSGRQEEISFHFSNGSVASWKNWWEGQRPSVKGNKVTWKTETIPDTSYRNFRKYLDVVFKYAGTLSLSKELVPVSNAQQVQSGDVFIHGGNPGHAVIVVDVAENDSGQRLFLIAQSYMPAQEMHVLKNPESVISPWYEARSNGILETPEWTFGYIELKRFEN